MYLFVNILMYHFMNVCVYMIFVLPKYVIEYIYDKQRPHEL